MDKLKESLKPKILEEIDLSKDITDNDLIDIIDRILVSHSREEYISIQEKRRLRKDIFNSIRRLDILQELIEDPGVTEIMVNGPDNIFIERNGTIHTYERCFESKQKLEDVIQQMVSHANRIINEACPIVDSRLPEELKNNKLNHKLDICGK